MSLPEAAKALVLFARLSFVTKIMKNFCCTVNAILFYNGYYFLYIRLYLIKER